MAETSFRSTAGSAAMQDWKYPFCHPKHILLRFGQQRKERFLTSVQTLEKTTRIGW